MDPAKAHQEFSCDCFNQTWGLLDLKDRSEEQVMEMISTSHASLYHWRKREDCTPENLSIGLWQLARVYALANSPQEAMRHAKACLKISEDNGLSPFCMAYAHEAVCRAAVVGDDKETAKTHLASTKTHAKGVTDDHDKKLIDDDIQTLEQMTH